MTKPQSQTQPQSRSESQTKTQPQPKTQAGEGGLADQLLEAQVRFHVERLTGDQVAQTLAGLAADLFAAAGSQQIADLIDREAIKDIVTRALRTVPESPAISGIIEMAVEVASKGPEGHVKLGEVVDRDQVEVLVDQLFAMTPLLERALDRLTESPMVSTMASRFMGRVAGEVLQANQAVADKIPGLGSLVSFGTSAASKVVGVADKQLEGLLGVTVGKGGTYAVRRLNKILVETIQDPATRAAVLQIWDLLAEEQLKDLSAYATPEQVSGVVDAGHDLAVTTLKHEYVANLAAALVDGVFEWFGGYTPAELLDQLQISRDDLEADLVRIAPRVLEALRESGHLEQVVRAQLAPFYSSAEVTALLG